MTSPRPEITELIERAAKAAGGQGAAARAAGLTPQHVSNWKQGLEMPTPEGAAALAHIAGLNARDWLARATLWRSAGKPYEGVLKKALGEVSRATGGASVLSLLVAVGALFESALIPRCILSKVKFQ